jgi:hypothetical protein
MLCLTPTHPLYGGRLWMAYFELPCMHPTRYPLAPVATFVITCTARIYLPSLLHAYAHAFITSSYTSNYLVCILPGCCLINKGPLRSNDINPAFARSSPLKQGCVTTVHHLIPQQLPHQLLQTNTRKTLLVASPTTAHHE